MLDRERKTKQFLKLLQSLAITCYRSPFKIIILPDRSSMYNVYVRFRQLHFLHVCDELMSYVKGKNMK